MTLDLSHCDPIVVDRYQPDGIVKVAKLMDFGYPFVGLVLKLDQGTVDAWQEASWAKQIFDEARQHPAWAKSFLGGLYDYLRYAEEGASQAEYSYKLVEKYNLHGQGFLPMMVDSERGGQRPDDLTKTRVEAVLGAWAKRWKELTGEDPTLYAGELHRALGITDHLGCARVWVAYYGRYLISRVYTQMGWKCPDGWQYVGTEAMPEETVLHYKDADGILRPYPVIAPGCDGLSDLTVITTPDPLAALFASAKLKYAPITPETLAGAPKVELPRATAISGAAKDER